MALAFASYFVNVTLTDAANTTRRRYELVSADDAEAATDAAALVTALAAVTDAVIIGYTIEKQFLDAVAVLPAITVQVENNALLTLGINGEPKKSGSLQIPAPKATVFVSTTGKNSNIVQFGAPVAAFVAKFVEGTAIAAVSDGEFVDADTARWKGKRIHHKSSRG